jgi:hypothetical protein
MPQTAQLNVAPQATADPRTQKMSREEFAARLKARVPALQSYSDDQIIEGAIARRPDLADRLLPAQSKGLNLPQNMKVENAPLAQRVKAQLRGMASGGKEMLPALGAGAAVAATPETGGLSDLLIPLVSAALGGAAGTSAKQLAGRALGEQGPKSTPAALQEDVQGGLEQMGYEAGGRALNSVLGRWVGKGAAKPGTNALHDFLGAAKATRARISNLTGMGGAGDEMSQNFEKVLGDIDETVKAAGRRPQTPNDVFKVVDKTGDRLEQRFNEALFPIRGDRVMPTEISDRIMRLITPDMAKTPAGRAEAAEYRRAAVYYQRPHTLNELNSARVRYNKILTPLYTKNSLAQSAALTHEDTAIMKAVRDGAADIVYAAVNKTNPDFDTQLLKQKQGALMQLRVQLDDRVSKLANAQHDYEGRVFREKLTPSAIVSSSGAHGYLRGLNRLIPGGGPERAAETKVTRAFASTPFQKGRQGFAASRRALILATPLANILRAGGAAKDISGKMPDDSEDNSE